jgi:hypothetical protein
VDAERFLTGQAYLEFAYTAEGTPIFIHQGGASLLAQGDKLDRPPTTAKVVSRFAKL